jgi:hypothetical protein
MSVSIVAGSWKQAVKYCKAVFRSGFHAGTAPVRQSYPENRLLPASSQPPTTSTHPITALDHCITTYGLSRSYPLLLIALFWSSSSSPLSSSSSFLFSLLHHSQVKREVTCSFIIRFSLGFLLNSHPAALVYNLCFRLINTLDLH